MIRAISFRDILDAPELLKEYSKECSIPELGEISPQSHLYEAMESSGSMECFGVFDGETMAGFATMILYVLPHYGKKVAATESIFLAKSHRSGRAGIELLHFLEVRAKDKGCSAFLYTAPTHSRFASLLAMRKEYRHTNEVFLRSL